jgi:hypothetical protein
MQNLSTLGVGYVIALIYDWRMALLVTGGCKSPVQGPGMDEGNSFRLHGRGRIYISW